MAFNLKKNKFTHLSMIIIIIISILGLFLIEKTKNLSPTSDYSLKFQAAKIMKESIKVIRDYKVENGLTIDKITDPNLTGLIGKELTPLTTTLGNLTAKRTATNPDFAALLINLFIKAGLKRGDVIAIGASGSFPSLILATLSAAKALELKPITICSLGSSMWGANNPELTWLDMENILYQQGLLNYRTVASSIGAEEDNGGGLTEEGKNFILSAIQRNQIPLIREATLEESIRKRLQIYFDNAKKNKIKLFINIGGASANFGKCAAVLKIPPGLNKNIKICHQLNRGIIYEMAEKDIPIIHLLDIRNLALKNGLPLDPIPMPEIGKGDIYYQIKYSKPIIMAVLGIIITLLLILRKIKFKY